MDGRIASLGLVGQNVMESLSITVKPVSSQCNQQCGYCFHCEPLIHEDAGDKLNIMPYEVVDTLIKKVLSEATGPVRFTFEGGEPTLAGLDFFKMFVSLERKHNVKRLMVSNTILTNGSLIDANWARFFTRYDFHVSLSMDGPKALHDAHRRNARGRGTHNRCLRVAALLRRLGVHHDVWAVVTKESVLHPEQLYAFFKENGIERVKLIPCMDELGVGVEARGDQRAMAIEAEHYSRFLCRMFDLWYEDCMRGDAVGIMMFEQHVHMLMGQLPKDCAMLGRCQVAPVVEADGKVFPCEHYVGGEFGIGHVMEDGFGEMVASERARAFVEPSYVVRDECHGCSYFFICRGGCRRDREPVREDGGLSRNVYCSAYKGFFEHAVPRLIDVANRTLVRQSTLPSRE